MTNPTPENEMDRNAMTKPEHMQHISKEMLQEALQVIGNLYVKGFTSFHEAYPKEFETIEHVFKQALDKYNK